MTIPNSVTNIESSAFDCPNLVSVKNDALTPQVIPSNVFSNYGTLYVKKGCKDAYESTDYWKNFTVVETMTVTDDAPTLAYFFYDDEEIEYSRSGSAIQEDKYGTFCLPFDINLSQTDCFKKVYTLMDICFYNTKTTYINLFLKENDMSSIIPANTPFIAKLNGNEVVLTNCSGVNINSMENPDPVNMSVFDFNGNDGALMENTNISVKFGGTFNTKAQEPGMYTFNTDGSFSPAAASLKPFRAYIMKESLAPVKGFSLNLANDEETALTTIKEEMTRADRKVYSLDGRAVTPNANQHGVYIINGKKIIR